MYITLNVMTHYIVSIIIIIHCCTAVKYILQYVDIISGISNI